MAIFIDTSNITEIERFHRMGVIRGVTTNPSILLQDGITGGMQRLETQAKKIAQLVTPFPVSVEVTSNDHDEMLRQALMFASWAKNINVKITIHGPEGETENLAVVHELETIRNIRVNVTAMMSAQQCLLAALAGATYVSIFGGRVNDMGYNVCGEIRKLRNLLDQFDLRSQIIVGSTRESLNVIEWLEAGAHIVTVMPKLLEKMIVHPYSLETVRQFLQDAEKALSRHKNE